MRSFNIWLNIYIWIYSACPWVSHSRNYLLIQSFINSLFHSPNHSFSAVLQSNPDLHILKILARLFAFVMHSNKVVRHERCSALTKATTIRHSGSLSCTEWFRITFVYWMILGVIWSSKKAYPLTFPSLKSPVAGGHRRPRHSANWLHGTNSAPGRCPGFHLGELYAFLCVRNASFMSW